MIFGVNARTPCRLIQIGLLGLPAFPLEAHTARDGDLIGIGSKPKNTVCRLKSVHFSCSSETLRQPDSLTAVMAAGAAIRADKPFKPPRFTTAGSSFPSDTRSQLSVFFTQRVTHLWLALKRNFRIQFDMRFERDT